MEIEQPITDSIKITIKSSTGMMHTRKGHQKAPPHVPSWGKENLNNPKLPTLLINDSISLSSRAAQAKGWGLLRFMNYIVLGLFQDKLGSHESSTVLLTIPYLLVL